MANTFLPVLLKLLTVMAIPLEKPKRKFYKYHVLFMLIFLIILTTTSLSHILKKGNFKHNPMNAILHILVYMGINLVDMVAIVQNYRKSRKIVEMLGKMDEIWLFLTVSTRKLTEKKLLKLQKFNFILIHVTLVPWLVFMVVWICVNTGFNGFLIYSLIYFNYYLTTVEVMKMLILLQQIKALIHQSNRRLCKILSERIYLTDSELKVFLENYDKLFDCVKLFNECFGVQILGTVVITPLVMVQAFFYTLSQITFPSLIRTIMVNVAVVIKFILFLVLSFMIATPSKRIAKEFQTTREICNKFRRNSNEVEKTLELLSLQLQNRETRISAFGFFDADYTIILNILVSTVNHVIVFLQINLKIRKDA